MNLKQVFGFFMIATLFRLGWGRCHLLLDQGSFASKDTSSVYINTCIVRLIPKYICGSSIFEMLTVLFSIAFLLRTYCNMFTRADVLAPLENDLQKKLLYDFTTLGDVNNWREISDTVRTVGMSKAVLALQITQVFQRAVFFTLLKPQPNGAGFAGVRTRANLNLTNFQNIEILCQGQGSNSHYKIVLRHKGLDSNEDVTYEQFFMAPMSDTDFSTVVLPLDKFKPYYRGREVPDADPLDKANITMIGLQVYGGVYMPIKQKGVSALEIEYIAVS